MKKIYIFKLIRLVECGNISDKMFVTSLLSTICRAKKSQRVTNQNTAGLVGVQSQARGDTHCTL